MMRTSLKSAVQDYYNRRGLSEARLQDLQALCSSRTVPRPRRYNWFLAPAWVGALALVVFAALSILEWRHPTPTSLPMAERIAEEVVRNHLKMKPLEVRTRSLDALRRHFAQLEFVPVQSELVARSGLQVEGGRYCSIQGIPAAQLRYSPADAGAQSLYQTEYRRDIFGPLPRLEAGESPLTVYHKGLEVRIWVEKGLLFAMTGSLDAQQ